MTLEGGAPKVDARVSKSRPLGNLISRLTPAFLSRIIPALRQKQEPKVPGGNEKISNVEVEDRARPKFAWVFDLDGTTLTKVGQSNKLDPQILDFAIKRATLGEPVCFLTARDFDGAVERTLDPLEIALEQRQGSLDPKILTKFFVISESGGDGYAYREDGTKEWKFDQKDSEGHSAMEFGNTRQLRELQDLALELAKGFVWEEEGITFPPNVSHLNTKKLFSITLERNGESTISEDEWRLLQSQYKRYFETQLAHWPESLPRTHINQPEKLEAQERMVLEQTDITTTIRPWWLTKAMGGQMFVGWLAERGIDPKMYNLFGDSESDLEIQVGIKKLDKPTHFYFVGKDLNSEVSDITVIGGNTLGTREILPKIVEE